MPKTTVNIRTCTILGDMDLTQIRKLPKTKKTLEYTLGRRVVCEDVVFIQTQINGYWQYLALIFDSNKNRVFCKKLKDWDPYAMIYSEKIK